MAYGSSNCGAVHVFESLKRSWVYLVSYFIRLVFFVFCLTLFMICLVQLGLPEWKEFAQSSFISELVTLTYCYTVQRVRSDPFYLLGKYG